MKKTILPFFFLLFIFSTIHSKDYVQIFDGKTLNGWEKADGELILKRYLGGKWEVENGAIVGAQFNDDRGSFIRTKKIYRDFEIVMDILPDWGCDSGLWIRTNPKGECLQIFIDYLQDGSIGFLHGSFSGSWSSRPWELKAVEKNGKLINVKAVNVYNAEKKDGLQFAAKARVFNSAWKHGEYNELKVRVEGKYPIITTWINGKKIMVFDGTTFKGRHFKDMKRRLWDKPSPYNKDDFFSLNEGAGNISLQIHPGKKRWNGKVRFKNIRVKEL